MLTLLPILCGGVIGLFCAKRETSKRAAFLTASIIWGVLLTCITEALSLIGALSTEGLSFSWGGAILLFSALLFLKTQKKERHFLPGQLSRTDMALASGILFLSLATLATALLAPPNNWDSMTYHMSRVVHWLQNRSVAHYPTHIIRQLELNPWAEFAIAHFQALSGGDRFANIIQWYSMLGSITGATLIARHLGAQPRGQLLAAVVAASIPMGILQASSTQNDYVVAFWLLCFVWSGIQFKKEQNPWWAFMTGASLGLALLTKGTAYLYALPFIPWFAISFKGITKRRVALLFLCLSLPLLVVNAGHYSRNWVLFSNPLGSEPNSFRNSVITPGTILSNIARNSAMHLATPFEAVNHGIEKGVMAIHDFSSIDINDERTTWPGTTFEIPKLIKHEDYSTNFFHALLACITLGLVFWGRSIRRTSSGLLFYVLAVFAGFFLFCSFLKWQPWNSRLQLPLFVLGAPAIGVVLGQLRRQGVALAVAVLLLVASLPWALRNISRPLLPPAKMVIDHISTGKPLPLTIVTAERLPQYFANRPELLQPYSFVTKLIKASGAHDIGLVLGVDAWEYPLWVLLNQGEKRHFRIEHVNVRNPSGSIRLINFHPDVIVQFDEQGYPIVTWP